MRNREAPSVIDRRGFLLYSHVIIISLPMITYATMNPCYSQKFFWVNDTLVAFEFGEHRWGNATLNGVQIILGAYYVWYKTDLKGERIGMCAYKIRQVASIEEGRHLFDLANEAGASEWLMQWEKDQQMTDPYGMTKIGQDIKRRVLSLKWRLRRWWKKGGTR